MTRLVSLLPFLGSVGTIAICNCFVFDGKVQESLFVATNFRDYVVKYREDHARG